MGETVDATTWHSRAACRGINPELFFPERGNPEDVEAALELCRACPVRLDCLEQAMTDMERDGIWGGSTGNQRRKLRRDQLRTGVPWTVLVTRCVWYINDGGV